MPDQRLSHGCPRTVPSPPRNRVSQGVPKRLGHPLTCGNVVSQNRRADKLWDTTRHRRKTAGQSVIHNLSYRAVSDCPKHLGHPLTCENTTVPTLSQTPPKTKTLVPQRNPTVPGLSPTGRWRSAAKPRHHPRIGARDQGTHKDQNTPHPATRKDPRP